MREYMYMYLGVVLYTHSNRHMHTQRPEWQLDPKDVPQSHDRIISNKTKSYSVVYEDDTVVLKKPIKKNGEFPSKDEFEDFMEFSAGLDQPNILHYDGVFFLESLRMPLMTCSVQQYCGGRLVKCDGKKVESKCLTGYGRMKPVCVMQVAVGVAKGLSYLHSQKGVSHDGLSSSNVLLKCKKVERNGKFSPTEIEEVKLVDYQLGLLGTSSQSHASRDCMYEAPKGTDPKRADLYSLGVLMVYMYTKEPKNDTDSKKQAEWNDKTSTFKNDPIVKEMWEDVVSKCLDIGQFPSLTADEVVAALETTRSSWVV